MSAVIRTHTPFVVKEVLVEALQEFGAEPIVVDKENISQYHHRERVLQGDIITNRSDYYGRQFFRSEQGMWVLQHDSSEMSGRIVSKLVHSNYKKVGRFLSEVEQIYENCFFRYQERLAKRERERLEEERKARVALKRKEVLQKAKEQGYSIKEKLKNGKIHLILTRSS